MQHRILFSTRYLTNLVETPPQEARERFDPVIYLGLKGDFLLQPALVDAVAEAERAADELFANRHAHQPNCHRT
eukprot:6488889-Prymnesium_polylepis.1